MGEVGGVLLEVGGEDAAAVPEVVALDVSGMVSFWGGEGVGGSGSGSVLCRYPQGTVPD